MAEGPSDPLEVVTAGAEERRPMSRSLQRVRCIYWPIGPSDRCPFGF